MESLGIQCGNSISFNGSRSRRKKLVVEQQSCFQLAMKNKKIKNSKPMQKIQITQACLSQNLEERVIIRRRTTIAPPSFPMPSFEKEDGICSWEEQNNKKISPENLDEWINDSVTEIVRNIGEAPFLVHLYSPATTTTNLELEREKAMPESWSTVRKRWEEGCPIPDGVILVEQLDKQKQLVLEIDNDEDSYSKQENEEEEEEDQATRLWGVLVQGRGIDEVACYILKTCRVWSSLGFCTHFCLIKAKCFGDTAELQLQNSWNGVGNGD